MGGYILQTDLDISPAGLDEVLFEFNKKYGGSK